jgi:hypothetical protein
MGAMVKGRMKLRWQLVLAVCMGFLTTVVITELIAVFWHPTNWNAVNQPLTYPQPPKYLGELVPEHTYTIYMKSIVLFRGDTAPLLGNSGIDLYEFTFDQPRADLTGTPSDIPPWIVLTRYRVGWPWRAFYWDSVFISNSGKIPNAQSHSQLMSDRAGLRYGVDIPLSSSWMKLPVMPVWDGLLLNVLLWSFLWCIPGPIRGGVRTYRRKRRGLCLACGYAIEDLERCPECGSFADAVPDFVDALPVTDSSGDEVEQG